MIKLYTKQDIAQLLNLSYKTLRVYEEKGLIEPVYINPQNGYKYYNKEQLYTVDMIRYSNSELDISLAEIKGILDTPGPQSALIELLQHKKEQAEIMIKKYQQIIENIEHSLSFNSPDEKLNIPYTEHIHGTFSYLELDSSSNTPTCWITAQKIYNYVGHKHFSFLLKMNTAYSEYFNKIGTIHEISNEDITEQLHKEFIESDFLCIRFKDYDNYHEATKLLENYAAEHKILLDMSSLFLEYHSLDISTLKLKDTVAILKIKILK